MLGYSMSFLLYFLKGIKLFRVGIMARELILPYVRVLNEFFFFLYLLKGINAYQRGD